MQRFNSTQRHELHEIYQLVRSCVRQEGRIWDDGEMAISSLLLLTTHSMMMREREGERHRELLAQARGLPSSLYFDVLVHVFVPF